MKIIYSLLGFVILSIIASCAGIRKMNSGAEKVNLYFSYPTKNCRFLGTIENPNVHELVDIKSSLRELRKDDNNFLRNEGARLGANVIVLLTHNSKGYAIRYVRGSKNLTTIYIHSITAKAYYCPSANVAVKTKDLEINETPLFNNDDFQIND
ncbi:DUF4156 domain-containing protein [Legionella gresilensis]|uniref:DUF4156 domain-containing protein n=1 Tax=Legionella gresilensis TaxID=91823 RepID=UPI0010416FA4|nr:DUF4156 domain-containing protein [Legionella gresilensis]